MVVLLRRCTGCQEYTLQDACPRCGAAATPNRPAKFSPEDQYGEYRRKLKRLDASETKAAADEKAAEDERKVTWGKKAE
ncbi:MAG TPA: RNA-protein complex protein Nop10 [Candidatus Thermoplasmatota archaeon]|nr:RNA-protein complex protein Nop10 [Candidatus Thermoplasmatota archaeon]